MDTLNVQPAQAGPVAAGTAAAGQPLPPDQHQSGDNRLAAILQKKQSGETLTAAERGYLGSVKRKGKRKVMDPQPAQNVLLEPAPASVGSADNPLLAAAPAPQAPAGGVAPPQFDSALVQKTAGALLDSVDSITQMWIGHEAKQAGGDEQTVAKYQSAVALQPRNRELMVQNSEPVVLMLCKLFKCAPDQLENTLRNSGFVGGLVCHTLAVTAAVKSIRESRAQHASQPTAPASPGPSQP